MTRYLTIMSCMLLVSCTVFAQGSRQIASRKIKSVTSRVTDLKKGKPVVYHTFSQYDRKGRLVFEKQFDSDSVCTKTQLIQYNRRGDVVMESMWKGDSAELQEKTEFFYDKFGRDTLVVTSDASGIKSKTISGYDHFDHKTEEVVFDNQGKMIRKSTMSYDKRGMLLTKKIVNESGETIYEKRVTYDY